MKFVSCVVVCVVAVLSYVVADSVPFTDCSSSSSLMPLVDLEVSPWPPTLGQEVTATMKFTAIETVTAGTYTVLVKAGPIKVLSETGDIADLLADVNMSLPIPEGNFAIGPISQTLPSLPVSGKITATISMTDQNGNGLNCVTVTVKPNPGKLKEALYCDSIKDQSDCVQASETSDGEDCLWCVSAAVPSSCANSTMAEKLPPSIFDCKR
jgi:hypothetical protein